MHYKTFGTTGWSVSTIGFGAWAIGGSWGSVDDHEAMNALNAAVDNGVNFIDTADVYGDGRSERLVGRLLADRRGDTIYVATKAGRRLDPHVDAGYTADNLNRFVDRSLGNLDVDAIDLLQLHCPPTAVYYRPEVFEALDEMQAAGKIRHYGVSVEKVEEALKAIAYPGVVSVQIIFNMFRQRPAELFFPLALERRVAILARVPLASGLLTGRMTARTTFEDDDHRKFNRHGEAFDVGETFAGVDFDTGLAAVERIRGLVPQGSTMAQFALRWIGMHDAVTLSIPGARNPAQATANAAAADLPEIDAATMAEVTGIYEQLIRQQVHHRW